MAEPILLLKQRFAKPNEINRYLYCPICIDVFKNPMRLFCGHTFCDKCVSEWLKMYSTCPECRETIVENLIGKDLIADNLIQDLEVYCTNKFCDWKQDLRNLPLHLQICQFQGSKEFQTDNIFEADPSFATHHECAYEHEIKELAENKSLKPLEQYHDLIHSIEEYADEDLLKKKENPENYLPKIFPSYHSVKKNMNTAERKKKRGHKEGEFDRETQHILKKSKIIT